MGTVNVDQYYSPPSDLAHITSLRNLPPPYVSEKEREREPLKYATLASMSWIGAGKYLWVVKVNVSNSVTYLIWTPMFDWYVVWFDFRNMYYKDVFKWDWTVCSKYDYHSMFNSQCNWVCVCVLGGGGLYGHLMSTSISCLMNETFIWFWKSYSLEIGLAITTITILYWSHVSYPRRRGLVGKSNHFKTRLPYRGEA